MKINTRKIDIAKKLLDDIINKLHNCVDIVTSNHGNNIEFSVTCYKNGRENGFTIRRCGKDGDTKTAVTLSNVLKEVRLCSRVCVLKSKITL